MRTCVGCGKQLAPTASDNICEGCYEGLLLRKENKAAASEGAKVSGSELSVEQQSLSDEAPPESPAELLIDS